MYKNLEAEIVRHDISKEDKLSKILQSIVIGC